MIEKIKEFLSAFMSVVIAILRLLFLAVGLIATGLHIILFNRMEICNIEMKGLAWRCDREKMADQMSFVDKICIENPDLLDYAEQQANEPPQDIDDDEEDEGNEE